MYLFIDTTQRESFSVAIVSGQGKVVAKKTVNSPQKHSEKLLAIIEKLLSGKNLSKKDLQGIAVVKGPGSFTSLRIGISTANALAYGLGASVIGVDKNFNLIKLNNSLFKKKRDAVVVPEYGQESYAKSQH